MVIRIYWASVTGNRKIEGDQTRVRNLIESLKISSEWIDITTDPLVRQKMRKECGNPTAMPPQMFNEGRYLGDASDMEEYVEQERVLEWFGICDVTNNTNAVDHSASDNGQPCEVRYNNVTNKDITSNGVIRNDATTVDGRSQSSPTSSVENEPPVIASVATSSERETSGIGEKTTEDQPARKSVLAAAGAFESRSKQPQPSSNKPRVIFSKSKSFNTSSSEDKKPIDDERRRRILGLSATDNSQSCDANVTSQSNTNDVINGQRNVNKVSIASDR